MMKLFKITCQDSVKLVVAGNEIEAKRILEDEMWDLSETEIRAIEEIDMSLPRFLCSCKCE